MTIGGGSTLPGSARTRRLIKVIGLTRLTQTAATDQSNRGIRKVAAAPVILAIPAPRRGRE